MAKKNKYSLIKIMRKLRIAAVSALICTPFAAHASCVDKIDLTSKSDVFSAKDPCNPIDSAIKKYITGQPRSESDRFVVSRLFPAYSYLQLFKAELEIYDQHHSELGKDPLFLVESSYFTALLAASEMPNDSRAHPEFNRQTVYLYTLFFLKLRSNWSDLSPEDIEILEQKYTNSLLKDFPGNETSIKTIHLLKCFLPSDAPHLSFDTVLGGEIFNDCVEKHKSNKN